MRFQNRLKETLVTFMIVINKMNVTDFSHCYFYKWLVDHSRFVTDSVLIWYNFFCRSRDRSTRTQSHHPHPFFVHFLINVIKVEDLWDIPFITPPSFPPIELQSLQERPSTVNPTLDFPFGVPSSPFLHRSVSHCLRFKDSTVSEHRLFVLPSWSMTSNNVFNNLRVVQSLGLTLKILLVLVFPF